MPPAVALVEHAGDERHEDRGRGALAGERRGADGGRDHFGTFVRWKPVQTSQR
jgi:hypothetical protein